MAEINVTPFVDVALVLLIIFMITAHVMEYGIEVDVPKTKSVATTVKELPAVVNLSDKGDLLLGSTPVSIGRLVSEIHSRYPGQTAVYVRADRKTTWDTLAQVASELSAGKFAINFVMKPDDSRTSR